jgi:hypothetical protein
MTATAREGGSGGRIEGEMLKKGATMKRKIGLTMACLLGGLMVGAVASSLRTQVQAADVVALQAPAASLGDVLVLRNVGRHDETLDNP